MMLSELAMVMHEERLSLWGADRPQLAIRREARGFVAGTGPSVLAVAAARSGRALSQLLGGGATRTAGPEGGAR